MAVLQPAGVSQSSVNRSFISDLNLIKPQAYDKFIDKYGAQNYVGILDMLGNSATVASREFFHFESRGKLHSSAVVGTITGGATAGSAVTINVTSASTNNAKSPLRVGEVIENAKTGVQYKITSVTDVDTCVASPLKASVQPDADIANGDTLLWRGLVDIGEGSSQGANIDNLIEKLSFTTTEIREDFKITDRAKMEELHFDFGDGTGLYTRKGMDDANRRFLNNREFKLMFGSAADNISGTVGTTGLVPYISANGQAHDWDADTNFDIADFQELARKADFFGGASEYHFLMDSYLRSRVDDALFAKYQNGAIVWANVGGSQDVAVKYGFDSVKVSGVTFHMKKYLPFNPEAVYGQTVSNNIYKDYGILIPMKDGRDAKTGDKIPSLRVVSNELSAGQTVKAWETGGLAKIPTSSEAVLNVHLLSYCGLQVFGVNQYMKVSK